MKRLHKIIILFVKYYSLVCSIFIVLTMAASICDAEFKTNFYAYFYKLSPTFGANIIQTSIIALFAFVLKMCWWNKILYVPIFVMCIYSQLYQLNIFMPKWNYYLCFIGILSLIASTILFANGRKKNTRACRSIKTIG